MQKPDITPHTKVMELLDNYPELEPVLLDLSPEFKKLKNPILRKTIGRVATLQQAAGIAKIPVEKLINTLREAAGMKASMEENAEESSPDNQHPPAWYDESKIHAKLDARPILETGDSPLQEILKYARELPEGKIFMLTTPFVPSPIIEKLHGMGFRSWTKEMTSDLFDTFFIEYLVEN